MIALAACACQRGTAGSGSTAAKPEAPVTDPSEPARDIHSFARPADARVTHVALDLRANFTDKRLSGTATLTLERRPGATELVLDTRDLDILRVADRGGATLTYALGRPRSNPRPRVDGDAAPPNERDRRELPDGARQPPRCSGSRRHRRRENGFRICTRRARRS